MYCPRCAAQNLDDAKFCRGCGTSLETVALALSGSFSSAEGSAVAGKSQSWIDERQEGIRKIIKASGLLGSSLLIGVALGLFGPNDWVLIWMVFVGWMACWGTISLFSGIGSLVESRFMRQKIDQGSANPMLQAAHDELTTAELPPSRPGAPLSVTEHTTKSLSQHRPAKET